MMFKVAKLGIAIAAVLALIVPAAYAGIPDQTNSSYWPQAGSYASPLENAGSPGSLNPAAVQFFRMCPNNDGGTSLPNNARIKVHVADASGNPISGVAAADICLLFNGGSPVNGFAGIGADSVVANSASYNQGGLCPDVRCVFADGPTDTLGNTWITFAGAPAVFGTGNSVRNSARKWGHYDTKIPVFVLGFEIKGRWNASAALDSYTLRIKSYDWTGGVALNESGEVCGFNDISGVSGAAKNQTAPNPFRYWMDFNTSGAVDFNDITAMVGGTQKHPNNHSCTFPNNP